MSAPEVATVEISNFKSNPMSELSLEVIEKVLVGGDLSVLNTKERLDYVSAVCKSVGLNPLTRPLEYIKLNNRLTLYARKDCTEQLRKIYNVSVDDLKEQIHDDVLTVTAYVSMPNGRKDASKGAVSLLYEGKNIKGEALANLFMKCETKAKRRATLSICGLGFLDETELEYIDVEPSEEVVQTKKKRERGSLEKLKKSESENRGHGNEGIQEAMSVPGVQKGTENLPYSTLTGDVTNALYHQSKDESKKWIEVGFASGEQKWGFSCWHQSLFECLLKKPKNITISVKGIHAHKGSITIEDVLSIDGVKYEKGVPYVNPEPAVIPIEPEANSLSRQKREHAMQGGSMSDFKPESIVKKDEQAKRNESLLELSNTLEKLWPAKDTALRPLRNKVGQMIFQLERKEQLMDLSYSQLTIDAAVLALKRYIDLNDKPKTEQGIQNEIINMFTTAKEELEVKEMPEPEGDLFA